MKEKKAFSFGIITLICSLSYCQVAKPYGELLFEDTISLMPLHEWITIPSPIENIWQIGKANKSYLDNSLSDQSIIVTDTINSYPSSADDYFLLSIPKYEHYAY